MVLVQKWPFFQFFFQAIQARNMSITIIYNKKTTFQAIKTRSSETLKIDIYPNGLTRAFGLKIAIFPLFLLGNIARKMYFSIFYNIKTPFQAIKKRSSKRRKIDIFPKRLTHGFGPKMDIFSTFFFQAIQARNMSITIFYNKKRPFQAKKTNSSKGQKIDIFPKLLTHGFGPKNGYFSIFFFKASKENVLFDISRTKKRLSRL